MINKTSTPFGYSIGSCGSFAALSLVAGLSSSGNSGLSTPLIIEDAIVDVSLDSTICFSFLGSTGCVFSPITSSLLSSGKGGGGVDEDMYVCRMAQLLRLDMRLCVLWKRDLEVISVRLAYINRPVKMNGGNVRRFMPNNHLIIALGARLPLYRTPAKVV